MSSWKIHYLKLTIFPATKLHWARGLMINNLFSRAASEKCIGIHQTGNISKIVGEHLCIDTQDLSPGFQDQGGPISREKNRGTNHTIPLKSKGVITADWRLARVAKHLPSRIMITAFPAKSRDPAVRLGSCRFAKSHRNRGTVRKRSSSGRFISLQFVPCANQWVWAPV